MQKKTDDFPIKVGTTYSVDFEGGREGDYGNSIFPVMLYRKAIKNLNTYKQWLHHISIFTISSQNMSSDGNPKVKHLV